MDGELEAGGRRVSSSEPSNEEQQKRVSYGTAFDNAFPEYIAMGMTYDQFWNMDAALVKAYRKARDIQREEKNFEMWLMGRYVYEAISALAPILRTSLSKKPVKAEKYVEKPFPLTEKAAEKAKEDRQKSRMMAALEKFKQEAEMNRIKRLQKEKEARKQNGE